MSSTCALAGFNVLSFTLAAPLFGVPVLQCVLDTGDGPAPSGAGVLSFAVADPSARAGAPPLEVNWSVCIIDAAASLGRCTVFAVGGAGALREQVGGIDYAEIHVRHAVEDILRDAQRAGVGEKADAASLAALDALPPLPRWTRPAGSGLAALSLLCRRAGIGWRIGASGLVRVGLEAWPAYAGHSTGQPYYTREPNSHGTTEVALDAPDLEAGQALKAPENIPGPPVRVSGVVHELSEAGVFRTHITVAASSDPLGVLPSEGRSRDIFRRAVSSVQPHPSFRVPWFATVVDQDSASSALGLRLDAEDSPPVLTLSNVPLWPGLPGTTLVVPNGSRCIVEFIAGREDRPIVRSFETNARVTMIQFGDNTDPFARVGDSAEGKALLFTGSGALSLVPRLTPGAIPIDVTITSGSDIFRG